MKKAFTIIELMVVVGILSILLTLVTTAVSDSMEMARRRKAEACKTVVQQGLNTYYAQKGHWPGKMGDKISNGLYQGNANTEGDEKGETDRQKYVLNQTEIDDMVRELVEESKKRNPMMDISGLFVSRATGQGENAKDIGLDFMQAVRGTKHSRKKMKVAEMHFGYPNLKGYFRPLKVIYLIPTDEMLVSLQDGDIE